MLWLSRRTKLNTHTINAINVCASQYFPNLTDVRSSKDNLKGLTSAQRHPDPHVISEIAEVNTPQLPEEIRPEHLVISQELKPLAALQAKTESHLAPVVFRFELNGIHLHKCMTTRLTAHLTERNAPVLYSGIPSQHLAPTLG